MKPQDQWVGPRVCPGVLGCSGALALPSGVESRPDVSLRSSFLTALGEGPASTAQGHGAPGETLK